MYLDMYDLCHWKRFSKLCESVIYNNKGDNVNTIQQKVSDANLYIVDHEMIFNVRVKVQPIRCKSYRGAVFPVLSDSINPS